MKLLLLDANSLINRAFFAIKGLKNSSGFSTNAIFGFYNIIEKILKEDNFTHIVAAFDLKAPTFRHKEYVHYKENRKKMPQELFLQLKETKKMLNYLGIKICEKEGFEADDVIGTLSRIFSEKKIKTVIATGDRDFFQLINPFVVVRLFSFKETIYYDENKILEKYGLTPKKLIEVKALMGDSSDNIPGVKGIGEKTALKLIQDYENVEKIFSDVSSLNVSERLKKILSEEEAKKMCYLSRFLGIIRLDVPIEEKLEFFEREEIKTNELIDFFKKFELNKCLASFLKENSTLKSGDNNSQKFKILRNPEIDYALKRLQNLEFLDFYMQECLFVFSKEEIFEFEENFKRKAFLELISKSEQKKRTTNLKEIYNFCKLEGFVLNNVVFSCDLAAYLIDVLEEDYSVSKLCLKYSKTLKMPFSFIEIIEKLESEIKRLGLEEVLKEVEIPFSEILSNMECVGIELNTKEMENFGEELKKEINSLKEEIFEECGEIFNLNSPKELAEILFNKLGLKKGRKTKTGYSTDIKVLEKLVKFNPVVLKIISYREKTKLLSTYVEGLKKMIKKDGRIHSHFNQTKTKTGRISSINPNIQNIPVKTEIGKNMRKFFVAKKGFVLIDADYSQIELRILASLANDEKMVKTFKENGDIHSLTAKEIFGFVNDETRNRAKIINFSVIYGISAFSLAKDIGVPINEARKYINSFFEGYVGVRKYFEETIKTAKETGFVKTILGRFRKINELNSKNKNILELGERIAKNTPIQGTAADIIKIAMLNIFKILKREQLNCEMVLQVHDEILVEVLKKDAEVVLKVMRKEMQKAFNLKVPLVVSIGVGKTWHEAKENMLH